MVKHTTYDQVQWENMLTENQDLVWVFYIINT